MQGFSRISAKWNRVELANIIITIITVLVVAVIVIIIKLYNISMHKGRESAQYWNTVPR